MDENTHLPEGTFRNPDESVLKPGINTKGSSATPVNEPVLPETLHVTQSLWPDADSVTPAPVSVSSKSDVPTVAAPLSTPPGAPLSAPLGAPPNIPLRTPPEHVSATSLIGSSPIESQPVVPASNFASQPAPDPHTRVAAFAEENALPASEPKVNAEPTTPHNLGSTAEYPPLKMIDADAVAPAMGARLSAYQQSAAAGETSPNIPATPRASATPAIPPISNVPVAPATPAASPALSTPATPAVSSIPATPSIPGSSSTLNTAVEPSATQVEPIPLEVHTKVVEPATYSESVAPVAPATQTTPIAAAAYGESHESATQAALNFDNTTPPAWTGRASAEEPAVQAAAEQPAIIPAAQILPEESPVAEPIEEAAEAAVEQITREQLAVASADQLSPEAERPEPVYGEPIEVEEEPVEKGISVITREATVLGDILTEGHIDIVGRVKGNIDAKGDVAIHGIVRGDVDGSKIGLYSCRVKGNLNAGLGVIVDDNSIIGGDVRTKNIIFDGKVKGNIDADNVVVLRSHSYCLGDVSAASLAVEPGAILNGKVRTFVDGDLEAPFDEVM